MISYFNEIKNRFLLIFFSQIVSFLSLCYYKNVLLFNIVYPILKLGNLDESHFILTDVMELFAVYLNLILFFNKQFLAAIFFYHLCAFLVPAWHRVEFLNVTFLGKIILSLWFFSSIVTNSILIPFSWLFFSGFHSASSGVTVQVYFDPKLSEYLNFYISFYWANLWYLWLVGLLLWLLNLPIITQSLTRKYRKFFYFCFVFFSTLICVDIFCQFIYLAFIIFSFEFIFIVKLVSPRQ